MVKIDTGKKTPKLYIYLKITIIVFKFNNKIMTQYYYE